MSQEIHLFSIHTIEEKLVYALKKLAEQGKKSGIKISDSVFRCRYRAPDGSKCLIGHLIPDALYTTGMEGTCVLYLFHHAKFSGGWIECYFWSDAQNDLHDNLGDHTFKEFADPYTSELAMKFINKAKKLDTIK